MAWPELLGAGSKFVISIIAAGGGGALVALGIFKVMGQQWLEQRFKQQMERLKHDQAKEIESARQKVQALFSRISKIHEKEFEVLPKAWFLLHTAHGAIADLTRPLKFTPGFSGMSELAFEGFLKEGRLSEVQQQELRAAPDRMKYYNEAIAWVDLGHAQVAQRTFHNYLIEHRIFMTDELKERFGAVDKLIADAVMNYWLWKTGASYASYEACAKALMEVDEKIVGVETAVQKRLLFEAA